MVQSVFNKIHNQNNQILSLGDLWDLFTAQFVVAVSSLKQTWLLLFAKQRNLSSFVMLQPSISLSFLGGF